METIKFRKFFLKTDFLLAQTEGKISENDICFILDITCLDLFILYKCLCFLNNLILFKNIDQNLIIILPRIF